MNNFVVEVNGAHINLTQADIVELLNSNHHLIVAAQQFALKKQEPKQQAIRLVPVRETKEYSLADVEPAVLYRRADNCKSFLLTFHSKKGFTKEDGIAAAKGRWARGTILQQYNFLHKENCIKFYHDQKRKRWAYRLTEVGKSVLPHITHRTSGR